MCRSMVDIQSAAAEIRREKKRKKETMAKILRPALFHRAAIKISNMCVTKFKDCTVLCLIAQCYISLNKNSINLMIKYDCFCFSLC